MRMCTHGHVLEGAYMGACTCILNRKCVCIWTVRGHVFVLVSVLAHKRKAGHLYVAPKQCPLANALAMISPCIKLFCLNTIKQALQQTWRY